LGDSRNRGHGSRCPPLWREAIKQAIAANDVAFIKELVDRVLSKTTFCVHGSVQLFVMTGLEKLAADVRDRGSNSQGSMRSWTRTSG
jgi:hypothetical protein